MPDIVADVPVPVFVTPPGERVSVQIPEEGNPLKATLPVATRHVGGVIVPTTGVAGFAFTEIVQVALAAEQGAPVGLFVVTVIVIVFPRSALAGVYVKEKGELFADAGETEPFPLVVMVTSVALPPKVFPDMVIIVNPQVLTLLLLRVTVGHCPKASNEIITSIVIIR
jgi:hypothetical protein